MAQALAQARLAAKRNEVPVGAVLVKDGKVLSRAHNLKETKANSLAHAELLALQKAHEKLKNWRLTGCTLYVTLEPCAMCSGALMEARVERVVFGAKDPKAGAAGSALDLFTLDPLNARVKVTPGVLSGKCQKILKDFFKKLRSSVRKRKGG